MRRLPLTADTVGPVARGHPWVYPDGVHGRARLGELVELVDGRGKRVAIGIGDEGAIAVRVLGREPMSVEEFIATRIRAATARRVIVCRDTDAYRLVNGEGDGLPGLVVDRYGDVVVLKLYARCWEPHLGTISARLVDQGARSVYRRFGVGTVDNREGGETLRGAEPPATVIVTEHGMKLLARVREGQKTGLFLDQREHRRLVRGWSADRRVVNLFAYSGGFSVAAALGGARHVTSVDIAPAAIDDARENFRLNGVNPAEHEFLAADAFGFTAGPSELVVCDPPSLTHAREADGAARGAYKRLHRQLSAYATDLVATSSCTARLSLERWEETVREGLGPGWAWLHQSAEAPDHPVAFGHPEGRYLKFALAGRLPR